MRKGAAVAWAALLMLVALSGGAAALSVATSPLVPDYGLLPANNAAAAAALDQAVEATLDAHSFTILVNETVGATRGAGDTGGFTLSYRIVYEAPNRSEIDFPGLVMRSIGSVGFRCCVVSGGEKVWVITCSVTPTQRGAGQAIDWLALLLNANSVQGSSGTYATESLETTTLRGREFVIRTSATIVVRAGRIASEDVTTNNTLGKSPAHIDVDYTDINTSVPVNAPPDALQGPADPGAGTAYQSACRIHGWTGYAPMQG